MAEKRLIDANALIELVADDLWAYEVEQFEHYVSKTPTVDAVEVVRCKDCKYYQEGKLLAPNKFCFRLKHPKENRQVGYNFSPDDFCSYGERRTNG